MLLEELDSDIRYLKGVGPKRASLFRKLGIEKLKDLLLFSPRDYDDWGPVKKIFEVTPGEKGTIKGQVVKISIPPTRKIGIVKVTVTDGTGLVHMVFFNQLYLKESFREGMSLTASGKFDFAYRELQLINPLWEEEEEGAGGERAGKERIVPIYPLTEGLRQKTVRRLVRDALAGVLDKISDPMPAELKQKRNLTEIREALTQLHFPESHDAIRTARSRLVYEEFLTFQTALHIYRKNIKKEIKTRKYRFQGKLYRSFIGSLPFTLTADQSRVLTEIFTDLARSQPMNRLLQGDVGSGKTVVALATAAVTVESGYQAALMAPTEILAQQHFEYIGRFFSKTGVKIVLLTGSMKKSLKDLAIKSIESGEAGLVIGTHALIQEQIKYRSLALVIIDEQHRFGVGQRIDLFEKAHMPDLLIMTATPIPRTLALTVYCDMEVSVIEKLPPGRKPIRTFYRQESKREGIYEFVKKELSKGFQCYIVYPIIEESEVTDLKAASCMYEKLRSEYFKGTGIGLIHGRLPREERERVMHEFKAGLLQVLVATSIIEVGIDVPKATVMIIEHPERFGLAQLHQLRGRIGRGGSQSYCILLSPEEISSFAKRRIEALVETTDGFKIAVKDLELRGPGEFFGFRQHGMTELKIGDIILDRNIMETAARDAEALIESNRLQNDAAYALFKKKLSLEYRDRINLLLG